MWRSIVDKKEGDFWGGWEGDGDITHLIMSDNNISKSVETIAMAMLNQGHSVEWVNNALAKVKRGEWTEDAFIDHTNAKLGGRTVPVGSNGDDKGRVYDSIIDLARTASDRGQASIILCRLARGHITTLDAVTELQAIE